MVGLFVNLYGGEGEIRTLDTISRIHTFQACSLSHSDTSPGLDKHCCLSRRANVAEQAAKGKSFFQKIHVLMPNAGGTIRAFAGHRHWLRAPIADLSNSLAAQAQRALTSQSAIVLYLADADE